MKLSTRVTRALRRAAYGHGWFPSSAREFESGPTPSFVARIDYNELVSTPDIGQAAIRDIRAWLQKCGLDICNYPMSDQEKEVDFAKKVAAARSLAKDHGWIVIDRGLKFPLDRLTESDLEYLAELLRNCRYEVMPPKESGRHA